MDYRREIDGLRALAVIPVILFHAGFQIFSGGFVGVDVFFVISGYLITTIIITELESGNFSLVNFYERRARRILPVLFFVMFICLPFSWLWLIPADMKSFSHSLIAVSTFSSNILFWRTSGYFDAAAEFKPLLHTWSLAVEEQYYLFFPIFLMLTWRLGRRWILGLLLIVFLFSLVMAEWASATTQLAAIKSAGFFLLPTRCWELLVGAFVAFYLASDGRKPFSNTANQITSIIGFCFVISSIFFFDKHTPFPGLYALLPTIGTAMIILSATPYTIVGRLLGSRIFVGVGLLSYSAYLWHQPLLAFVRHKSFDDPSNLTMLFFVVVTLIFSYFSWRFIEAPFRKKSHFGRRYIFSFALSGSVFFILMGVAGYVTGGFSGRAMAVPFKPFVYDMARIGYKNCEDKFLTTGASLNYCYESMRGKMNAVLIGDSHADDKFYGIEKNSEYLNWGLVGNSSCPLMVGVDVATNGNSCIEKTEKIVSWIVNSDSIKNVAISFYSNYALTSTYAADHIRLKVGPDTIKITSKQRPDLSRTDLFYFGLSQAVGKILSAGKKVVILVDVPELPFFPLDCVKGRPNCEVPLSVVLERQSMYRKLLDKLKKEFPDVQVYDPLDLFCSGEVCGYKRNGIILYRDSHHLTLEGSDLYGKKFTQWFAAHAK